MSDLAVILVNWNTCRLTCDALRTLYLDLDQSPQLEAQVWVVDNASTDDSVESIRAAFPRVRLIANSQNVGFGAGNNLALRALGFSDQPSTSNPEKLPRAVYLLNSDTLTHPGATLTLFEALLRLPQAGVVGARLTFGDGSFQHSAFAFPGLAQLWIDLLPAPGRFYESRLNGRYPRHLYQGSEPFPVGHTLGATMLIRREAIQQTGLFDEQFEMYAEEVDWSWRIQRAGWGIYCVPSAHVTHLGGQSTGQARPRSLIQLWTSRLKLYDKYYPRWKKTLAQQIIRWGMGRCIRRTQADPSLSAADRQALLQAYQRVIDLTRR